MDERDELHNELQWNYRAYSILMAHCGSWNDTQIQYLSDLTRNIEIMEEYLK